MKPFPHPDLPFRRDAMQQYGDMFIFAAFMFNFILQLSYIVKEKELRLREAMKQMGLKSISYWTSWLITNTLINIIQVLLLCITGLIFQFDFFL
jgi:ABC-type multidrug transport system permease subunit